MKSPESNFEKLGLELPPAPVAGGVYKSALIVGNLMYLSGHGPVNTDGSKIIGKVGQDLSDDEGKLAARQVGLTLLATIRQNVGSLNRVKRVIKLLGMVNCTTDYKNQPHVINGCSELFAAVWGDDLGVGTRSAVGMGSLPGNIAVEIEAIVELHN